MNKITVITLSKSIKQRLDKKVRVVCPKLYFVENFGKRIKFLISLIFLFKEIVSNRNATVLCFQGLIYCTLLCKITRTNIIIRSNSSPSGWSQNFLKKFLYKKIYGLADKIIVNSLYFKKELYQKFNLKSICIYNPLDKKEIIKTVTLGRLETSEDFKISEKKEELPKETLIENLKIKVRKLSDQDIKTRNLPNQTNGLVITSIEKNSPLTGSIEKNSIILEAQKKKIRTVQDLNQALKQVLNSNQKTILLVIYNSQNQKRYIGVKLD